MTTEHPSDEERIEQLFTTIELTGLDEELAGSELLAWEVPDQPTEVGEQFWQQIIDGEKAPWTNHFDQLRLAGVELSAPEDMNDIQLMAKLQEVIAELAKLRVFLHNTDHLSDRELYTLLWQDTLHEAYPALPVDELAGRHIDLVSSGSEEDIQCWLMYYASVEDRCDWLERWPDNPMPERARPPFDRDRHLPRSDDEGEPSIGFGVN